MEDKPIKKDIQFNDIEQAIVDKLNSLKLKLGGNWQIQQMFGHITMTESARNPSYGFMGGAPLFSSNAPMVMLVNTDTFEVRLFALRALFPDLEWE